MARALTLSGALATVFLVAAVPVSAQWLKTPTPGIPRTADGKPNLAAPAPKSADGHPDLSGLWRADPGGYSLNIVSDLKSNEVLPWADELSRKRSEEFGKDHPGYRCMPDIGAFSMVGIFKILQTPTTMAFLPEGGQFRQVLTDGRALPVDPQPTWGGYSIGRWDGDVFVVESAGFNDRTWLDFSGHPHTEALRVTERIRRPDFGHLRIRIDLQRSQGLHETVDHPLRGDVRCRHRAARERLQREREVTAALRCHRRRSQEKPFRSEGPDRGAVQIRGHIRRNQ
jgi:hypothetical protein